MIEVDPRVKLLGQTPADASHFFGFHDITPWNTDETHLLLHRLEVERESFRDLSRPIDIALWHPGDDRIEKVASTEAWNWQQGARLQWLPGGRQEYVFNVIDDGKVRAECRSVKGGAEPGRWDFPVYALHPTKPLSLYPDFGVISRHWTAYGYQCLADVSGVDWRNQAISLGDYQNGEVRAVVRLPDLLKQFPIDCGDRPQFMTHPTFSPSGERFCFLHRFTTADEVLYTRLFISDLDGNLKGPLAEEKVSHFDWIDEDRLWVWTRFLPGSLARMRRVGILGFGPLKMAARLFRKMKSTRKTSILNERYYEFDLRETGAKPKAVLPDSLTSDGHPMFTRDARWCITDTYPLEDNVQKLLLVSRDAGTVQELLRCEVPEEYLDLGFKCDFHPRWSPSERFVCIDTPDTGRRQLRVVDVSGLK